MKWRSPFRRDTQDDSHRVTATGSRPLARSDSVSRARDQKRTIQPVLLSRPASQNSADAADDQAELVLRNPNDQQAAGVAPLLASPLSKGSRSENV
jgi:hypothetical protein